MFVYCYTLGFFCFVGQHVSTIFTKLCLSLYLFIFFSPGREKEVMGGFRTSCMPSAAASGEYGKVANGMEGAREGYEEA